MKKTIYSALFLLIFITAAFANDTVSYHADIVNFDRNDTIVRLAGNSSLTYQSVTLTADTIQYHTSRRIMIATGNPVMIDGTDTLEGDYIAYNLREKTGKVRHGNFDSKDDIHYAGQRITRGKDEALYIDNGSYTTSQAIDSVHYFFYGKKIKLITNDKAIVKPFVLNIEDAPVAALPFIIAPLDKDRTNGLLTPKWGVGIDGSGSIDNIGYYWAPNDYVDFLVAGKIDNFESYLVKGETNYALKNKLSGNLRGEYSLNDSYRSGSNRWSIKFNHNQYLLPDNSLTLKGRGQIQSDKDYHTDYSEDTTDLLNRDLSADISLTKRFKKLGGYADVSWNRKQNLQKETMEQSLPSLRFTLNQRPLIPMSPGSDPEDEMWFNKIRWSYTAKANQKFYSSDKEDSSYNRSHKGFSHSIPISAPFEVFKYLTVTPNISLNHSIFDSYSDTTSKDSALVWDTTYQEVPIDSTRTVDFKDSVANNVYVVVDTIEKYSDSIVRFNMDSVSHYKVTMDTTYYGDSEFDMQKANNFWWNAGVSLNTKIYGMFPVNMGPITGFRHTFSPSASYRFTPEKELDVIFPTSIGISSTGGTKQQQVVSFSANNLFEGRYERNGSEKKIKLLTLNLNGSYNFEAEEEKWSNFGLSGSVPTPYVDLSYSGSYTPYDPSGALIFPSPLNHSLRVNPRLPAISGSIWSGDYLTLENVAHDTYMDGLAKSNTTGWRLNLSPRYNMSLTRPDIDQPFKKTRTYNLGTGFKLDFSHRWSIKWNGDWSFTEGTFINQNVSLYGDLESWEMKFDWYPTGINSGRFYFTVNIKKHRDIQWEKKEL